MRSGNKLIYFKSTQLSAFARPIMMSQYQFDIPLFFHREGYYEIAYTIMNQLTASDVGALLASLRITPTQHMKERILQPLRDFDHNMRLFEPWFHEECQILIIGPDTVRLNDRILNADEYYKRKRPHQNQLEVCILQFPTSLRKAFRRSNI
jgi:hypothetical protein